MNKIAAMYYFLFIFVYLFHFSKEQIHHKINWNKWLHLFVTFIVVFENNQNSFSCGPTFCPFWSVKYLNFGQKLPIRTAHYRFLESRHPEVFKNLYYVLSNEGSQRKGISSWTINITKTFRLINSKNLRGEFY